MNNADMPAMPIPDVEIYNTSTNEEVMSVFSVFWGLTKRERFAGLAMQGILSNNDWIAEGWEDTARRAVNTTDALLKELSK